MRRTLIGLLFVLHGLAHAGAGMWAADRGPAAIVTPLWAAAMLGFVAAGFGLLGMPGLHRRWEALSVTAVAASLVLLLFFGHLANPVHEVQRLPEVGEAELPPQMMTLHDVPVRDLPAQIFEFGAFERRNVAAARRTRSVCQPAH